MVRGCQPGGAKKGEGLYVTVSRLVIGERDLGGQSLAMAVGDNSGPSVREGTYWLLCMKRVMEKCQSNRIQAEW